mmetsp:Transcript_12989/g.22206  ORF Transcript_12989/g.22206 Transcript_12989/m.22206 type:complete len:89 (+) Transcript_12989:25-291(+)
MGLFGHTYHGPYDEQQNPRFQSMIFGFAIGGAAGSVLGVGLASFMMLSHAPMRALPFRQKMWIITKSGLQSGGTFGFLFCIGTLLRSF